jgi:hypothetical protein
MDLISTLYRVNFVFSLKRSVFKRDLGCDEKKTAQTNARTGEGRQTPLANRKRGEMIWLPVLLASRRVSRGYHQVLHVSERR